ncbi:MAG: right-handed parallel beta-helix repeat-containing protein [Planctomycetota bacterium]
MRIRLGRDSMLLACVMTLSCLVTNVPAHSTTVVIHVDASAPADGDGTSWTTAFASLSEALEQQNDHPGRTVEYRIAGGVYVPEGLTTKATFLFGGPGALRGGFAGLAGNNPDEQDWNRWPTILSGDRNGDDQIAPDAFDDNALTVITAQSGGHILMEGLVIESGRSVSVSGGTQFRSGGGLFGLTVPITIQDCVFRDNSALASGGAVYFVSSSADAPLIVERTVFESNHAAEGVTSFPGGGAVTAVGAHSFVDCTFRGNTSVDRGGAVYVGGFNTQSSYVGCEFAENHAATGGGLFVLGSMVDIDECAFIGNTADDAGGGIGFDGSVGGLMVASSTFQFNTAERGAGLGGTLIGFVEVSGSTFEDNLATNGGAIGIDQTPSVALLEVDTTEFTSNVATLRGGGVYSTVSAQFVSCTFDNNVTFGDGGGAYLFDQSFVRVESCSIVNNSAAATGGGLFVAGSGITVVDTAFGSNSAVQRGGGLHAVSAQNVQLEDLAFVGNTCDVFGGGIAALQSQLSLRAVTAADNDAAHGGGVSLESSEMDGVQLTLEANTAIRGGGLYADSSNFIVGASEICSNIAGVAGGGVMLDGISNGQFVSVLMATNASDADAGGIRVDSNATLRVSGCTVTNNSAGINVGGIDHSSQGEVRIDNSILWDNTDQRGGTRAAQFSVRADGPARIAFSCGNQFGGLPVEIAAPGNIETDPVFIDPSGDDQVPGTADDDFRLSFGSPCIDAGSNIELLRDVLDVDDDLDVLEAWPFDRRLNPRQVMVEFDRGGPSDERVAVVDMGSDEFNGPSVESLFGKDLPWSSPETWSEDIIPNELTDVTITSSVTIGSMNMMARDVVVAAGARLTIEQGSLSCQSLVVNEGGELRMLSPVSVLNVGDLIADSAALVWEGGTIDIGPDGLWAANGPIQVGGEHAATLILQRESQVMTSLVTVAANGELTGRGTISGDVVNEGVLRPGLPLGALDIGGHLTQSSTGLLDLRIQMLSAAGFSGRLLVGDLIELSGTVTVRPITGFTLDFGSSVTMLSGALLTTDALVLNISALGDVAELNVMVEDDRIDVVLLPPHPRLYVNPQAGAGGIGTGWSSPLNSLQEALDRVETLGAPINEIWVTAGTFVPSIAPNGPPANRRFTLPPNVSLIGGFVGSEQSPDDRTFADGRTVISGDMNGDDLPGFVNRSDNVNTLILAFESDQAITLDGFRFRGVNPTPGGSSANAVWCNIQQDVTIRNCEFVDNAVVNGSLRVSTSQALVEDCVFEFNTGTIPGINMAADSATILNGIIRNNAATASFSTICSIAVSGIVGEIVMDGTVFTDNSVGNRQVAALSGGDVSVNNTAFTNNAGQALRVSSSGFVGTNLLFEANESSLSGAAIEFLFDSVYSIHDSIFRSNRTVEDDDVGGAIYARDSVGTLHDCTFELNTAWRGGAIYVRNGGGSLHGCTFETNESSTGGAIFAEGIDLVIADSWFVDNRALRDAGAILSTSWLDIPGSASITDTRFEANLAGQSIGALVMDGEQNHVERCHFESNSAVIGRAAVEATNTTFLDCEFIANTTFLSGGALHVHGSSEVLRCRFEQNFARRDSALRVDDVCTVRNSLFAFNTATLNASAIGVSPGAHLNLTSSTVVGHAVVQSVGAAIETVGQINEAPSTIVIEGSILWNNQDVTSISESTQVLVNAVSAIDISYTCVDGLDQFAGNFNLDDDPLFESVTGDNDDAGMREDFRLRADSPLINAGRLQREGGTPMLDLDGSPRISNCRIDLGAFETAVDGLVDDCNGNGFEDPCEILASFSSDCNMNAIPDDCEFDTAMFGDCNDNGFPDSCETERGCAADCNRNGIPDVCDVASARDGDCNLNGIPDSCDLSGDRSLVGGPLMPVIEDSSLFAEIDLSQSVTGDIEVTIKVLSRLDTTQRGVRLIAEDALITNYFVDSGEACPIGPQHAVAIIARDDIVDLNGDGVFTIEARAFGDVDECDGSVMTLAVDYTVEPTLTDDDGDSHPDDCDDMACPADCVPAGGDGVVDVDELLAIILAFGSSELVCDVAPPGGDGVINISDLIVAINGLGECP